MCVRQSAQGGAHELSRGPGRGARRVVLPARRAADRLAEGAVLARAVHRARRLHGGSAEEVLPARAGARSAAALRLLHHVHRRRQGRVGRGRRAALHVRSRHPRRRLARRPEGAGHDPLGLGARTRSTASCGCTTGCSRCPIRTRCRRARTSSPRSTRSRSSSCRARRSSRAWRRIRRARGISSSEPATSSATRSTRKPGALVFNRTVTLRDQLGEGEGQVGPARPENESARERPGRFRFM